MLDCTTSNSLLSSASCSVWVYLLLNQYDLTISMNNTYLVLLVQRYYVFNNYLNLYNYYLYYVYIIFLDYKNSRRIYPYPCQG